MSKYEPKNREEAFTYQWERDVQLLQALAVIQKGNNNKEFLMALETLKLHINSYEELNAQGKQ